MIFFENYCSRIVKSPFGVEKYCWDYGKCCSAHPHEIRFWNLIVGNWNFSPIFALHFSKKSVFDKPNSRFGVRIKNNRISKDE